MTDKHGDFVWYEVMTTNPDAAEAFYGALLGWKFRKSDTPGIDYRLGSMSGAEVVGMMALTPEMCAGGARPTWIGYIAVDDIDAGLARLEAAGGARLMGPQHLPGVGHMAMVTDPQGAAFYLMQSEGSQPSLAYSKHGPKLGHCAWNELATTDPAAAHGFYTSLFGWQQADVMDMGALGDYAMYRHDDYLVSAIYRLIPGDPVSHWLAYFRVADIAAAARQIRASGGSVVIEPQEIPGGEYSLTATDPDGAFFGLVGPMGGQ
jgi:uncharacterized protein